jgi:hypothetical protein
MLLNGDGDVITAHRLLTQAIEDQTGSKGPDWISDAGLFEAISTLFIVCVFGGRAELWAPFHAALDRFASKLPTDLYLLSQTHADPARTAVAVLPQVDAAVASLRGETDHLRILTVSSTAHFTDRQDGCREAVGRVVREVRQGSAVTPLITALEQLSHDAWMMGRWDRAQELADECLELCLAHGYVLQTWTIRYRQALIAAARGAYDAADALTAEMTGWAAPRRIGQADLAAHHVGSVAALGRGDFEAAYRHAAAISPAGSPRLPCRLRPVGSARPGRGRRTYRSRRRGGGPRGGHASRWYRGDLAAARLDHGRGRCARSAARSGSRPVRGGTGHPGGRSMAVRPGQGSASLRGTATPGPVYGRGPGPSQCRVRYLPAAGRTALASARR